MAKSFLWVRSSATKANSITALTPLASQAPVRLDLLGPGPPQLLLGLT